VVMAVKTLDLVAVVVMQTLLAVQVVLELLL
jgi:hypothetical protein